MSQNTSNIDSMDDTVTIIQFLKRPVKLDYFKLVPGESNDVAKPLNAVTFSDPQPFVRRYNLPGDILSKGGKLDKANNHQYFKADIHIKVVLNTNPFVAGRFYLTYSPYENLVSKSRQQLYSSRAGVTAYPGVEIDVQIKDSIEIVIPFASYKEAYVLTGDKHEDFITLYLYALTPVLGPVTASKAEIDFTFYAWFENISLIMPTVKPLETCQTKQIIYKKSDTDTALEVIKQNNPGLYTTLMQYMFPDKFSRNRRKQRDVEANWDNVEVEIQIDDPLINLQNVCFNVYKYIDTVRSKETSCSDKFAATAWIEGAKYDYPCLLTQVLIRCKEILVRECENRKIQPEPHDEVDSVNVKMQCEEPHKKNMSYVNPYIKQFSNDIDKLISQPTDERELNRLLEQKDAVINSIYTIYRELKIMKEMCWTKVQMQIQAEAKQNGPITEIANTVSSIAEVAEGIPIVKEIATPVKWIADIVSGISSIFGWSKPTDMSANVNYSNLPGKNFTHIKGVDNGVSLSLGNENELGSLNEIFPSAVDEMDINYVCQNPAVKDIWKWNVNDPVNKTLGLMECGITSFTQYFNQGCQTNFKSQPFEWNGKYLHGEYIPGMNKTFCPVDAESEKLVGPTYPEGKYVAEGRNCLAIMDTAPCEYVAQMFQYWRATLCFKISVVKTAFHTGRLEIFFDPGPYFSAQQPKRTYRNKIDIDKYDEVDTTNAYKYILDLTNDTEVTIKIPFVSEKLLLSTLGTSNYSSALDPTKPVYQDAGLENIFNSIIGSLVVRPVSKLLAPETVSEEVQIVVWKWAEDVVLSVPKFNNNSNLIVYDLETNKVPPTEVVNLTEDEIDTYMGRAVKWLYAGQNCSAEPYRPTTLKYPNTISDKLPLCTQHSVRAKMQINLANKAEGNVVVLFNSKAIEKQNMQTSANVVGERLVNLRPLLRAFRFIMPIDNEDGQSMWFDFQEDYMNKPNFYTDYLSYLSYMYRFFRGGMRYKLFTVETKPKDGVKSQVISSIASNTNIKNNPDCGPTHVTYQDLNPVHEVSVPYYSQYRKLPISLQTPELMALNVATTAPSKFRVYRSGNDDLTYGWLMGTPQLYMGHVREFTCVKKEG